MLGFILLSILGLSLLTFKLFYRRNIILFFICLYLIAQASILHLYKLINTSGYLEIINRGFIGGSEADLLDLACFLSLIGLFFFVLGLGLFKVEGPFIEYVDKKQIRVYLFLFIIISLSARLASLTSGSVRQVLICLFDFQYLFYYLVIKYLIDQGKNLKLIVFVLACVAWGFSGYFAGFTMYLFIVFIVLLRRNSGRFINMALFALFSFLVVGFWQSVKGDYRYFLASGENSQNVVRGYGESYDFLFDKSKDLQVDEEFDVINSVVSRLSYIEICASVLYNVPRFVPHVFGELFLNAFGNAFKPRFFFPDKRIIDESYKTNRYSSINVSGTEDGTSISLGLISECYVDFGFVGIIEMFFLGFILSVVVKWASDMHKLVFLGLQLSFLANFRFLETSFDKFLTKIMIYIFVILVLKVFNRLSENTFYNPFNK